jgi:hypothetical protein
MNDKTAEQLRTFRRNPSMWVSVAKEIMSNAIGKGIVMEGSNMLWRVVSAELESGFGSSGNAPSALCELTAVFGNGDRKLHVSIDDLKRAVILGPDSSSSNTRADSGEAVAARDAESQQDLRNLIYASVQFDNRGETDLTWSDISRLTDRGWMVEGEDNGTYDITDEGQAAIDAAIASREGEGNGGAQLRGPV